MENIFVVSEFGILSVEQSQLLKEAIELIKEVI